MKTSVLDSFLQVLQEIEATLEEIERGFSFRNVDSEAVWRMGQIRLAATRIERRMKQDSKEQGK